MGNFPLALSFSHSTLCCASVSFSGFCFFSLSLSLFHTLSHFSHFRRQRPADSLMAASGAKMKKASKKHQEKWNMKNTFCNHLIYKASSLSSSSALLFFILFHFSFSLSQSANEIVCQRVAN